MRCQNTAMCLLVLIFFLNEQGDAFAGEIDSTNQLSVFRYFASLPGSTPAPNLPTQMTCVATSLIDGWTMTAGHCIQGKNTQLSFLCKEKGDQYYVETLQLNKLVRHETHDLALFKFVKESCYANKNTMVTTVIPRDVSFVTPVLSAQPPAKWQMKFAKVNEVDRDEHTLRLSDDTACLTKGDSGAPFFVLENNAKSMVAAILITGSNDCPSVQTAARLDRLLPWIRQTMAKKNVR